MKNFKPFRFLELLPFIFILSTTFVVDSKMLYGVIYGKYFWFYASMGLVAVASFLRFKKTFMRLNIADLLVFLFGVITLSISYFIHSSEATTKHILLLLVILLYFYFRMLFQTNKYAVYWLCIIFIFTGLTEAYFGLQQLHGYTRSQHSLYKLTGTFFNPGPYSCYLAVVLPVAFYYLLRDRHCAVVKFGSPSICVE